MKLRVLSASLLFACTIAIQLLANEPGNKHALLVGVTKYDHLDQHYWLQGPANDVVLIRDLLTNKFRFKKHHITVLAEGESAFARPIKNNIRNEHERLARVTKKNDFVVVFLSGHGSQQPDDDPENPLDVEPDGFDEVFLPADVRAMKSDDESGIANAITDDEQFVWLKKLRDKGVHVWFIADSCHSGSVARTHDQKAVKERLRAQGIVSREISRSELMPQESIDRAIGAANRAVIADEREPLTQLAAVYASYPYEETVEMPLPQDSEFAKPIGLLTYTLTQTLTELPWPITYDELLKQVRYKYQAMGRSGPTPLAEGMLTNHLILSHTSYRGGGASSGRPDPQSNHGDHSNEDSFLLNNDEGSLTVNRGSLHGLSANSILALYTKSKDSEQPIAFVRIDQLDLNRSTVSPCALNGGPKDYPNMPKTGFCEVSSVDLGDLKIGVAVDVKDDDELVDSAVLERIRNKLAALSEDGKSVFRLTERSSEADWLVQIHPKAAVLVPARESFGSGESASESANRNEQLYGPVPLDDRFESWMVENLSKISRVRNLIHLAVESQGQKDRGWWDDDLDISLEIRRLRDVRDHEGEPIETNGNPLAFKPGDLIAIRALNNSPVAVRATLIFLDSEFGIHGLFPRSDSRWENFLEPGVPTILKRLRIEGNSFGTERMILIAMVNPEPIDFLWLEQKSIDKAIDKDSLRTGKIPFVDLLTNAAFGKGQRGLAADAAKKSCVRIVTWETVRP